MSKDPVKIEGRDIYLAESVSIQKRHFIGRERELTLCKAAWGIDVNNKLKDDDTIPLHFRLQGPPGFGKNEIVYELARQLNMELYIIQGHEELTPEDLALLIVPGMIPVDPDYPDQLTQSFVLRASPLATAIYKGGLFFFDEINRVPERALSPLSSVLDGRQSIYSAMAGIHIGPRGGDNEARKRFRFCCALNPALSQSGHVLPDYIEQRTLPVIEIDPPPFKELLTILEKTLSPSEPFLDAFVEWYNEDQDREISVRQAIALMNYAINYKSHSDDSEIGILRGVQSAIFGKQRERY